MRKDAETRRQGDTETEIPRAEDGPRNDSMEIEPLVAQALLKLADVAGLPCGIARREGELPLAVIQLTSGVVALPLAEELPMRVRSWWGMVEEPEPEELRRRLRAFVQRGAL